MIQGYIPISRYSSKRASRPGSWSWKSSSHRVYFLARFLVLKRCRRLLHQLYIFLQNCLYFIGLVSKNELTLLSDAYCVPLRVHDIVILLGQLYLLRMCYTDVLFTIKNILTPSVWKLGQVMEHLHILAYSYCSTCILIVRPCILNVVYVFLLFVHVFLTFSMYSYCSSMYSYCCVCILIVAHVFLDAATLTEVFPRFYSVVRQMPA